MHNQMYVLLMSHRHIYLAFTITTITLTAPPPPHYNDIAAAA